MAKFKVGDKVRVRRDLVVDERYGFYEFVEGMLKSEGKIVTIKEILTKGYRLEENGYAWTDEMLEEVKEDKMEKTFREVIADIKEGEVWGNHDKKIKCHSDGIQIYHVDRTRCTPSMLIIDTDKFTLQRKEYTFKEAFKAYEEGKEIESVLTGDRFKKSKRVGGSDFDSRWDEGLESWWKFGFFELELIRGKWYIND